MGAPKLKKPDLVSIVVDATLQTLKAQCNFEAKAGTPFSKDKDSDGDSDIAYGSTIKIISSQFRGVLAVGFSEKVYLKIMSGMLHENLTKINKDIADGVKELANIIFCCAKQVLNDAGHDIARAVPEIVRGEMLKNMHQGKTPVVVLPFNSKEGTFKLELLLDS